MEMLLVATFVVGYLAIVLEHNIHVNKSAPALIIGILCWTIYALQTDKSLDIVHLELHEHLAEIAGVLFFLLGAMTIVELIDAHEGFEVILKRINAKKKTGLLWMLCFLTFFLSALLDNLTTTIVMVSILRKLIKDRNTRLFFIGMVVISANAGGAWSPIGDVTTTMLWIGGQVSTANIIKMLIVPSLFCLIVPLSIATFIIRHKSKKENKLPAKPHEKEEKHSGGHFKHEIEILEREKKIILFAGVGALLFAPIFKTYTHLPPFMGIMLSLGVLWLLTEILHKDKNDEVKSPLSVMGVLKRVDTPSILFFFGILLAISSLQATGILKELATTLDHSVGNIYTIGYLLGLLSAIVDNVPLVAAAMGMYDLAQYPTDHVLWEFIAYCAGTGGSALIIGSASGVAAMGMERISFIWYLKNISWLALAGYSAGAFIYIVQIVIFHP